MMMEATRTILKQYWGYTSFRPLQEEAIRAVLADKDVLALMPTGAGKSLCFQVPALLKEGTCLVVSPLIALMQDQVSTLRQQGIAAAALYTGMSTEAMDMVLDRCVYGKNKLLYLSPERLHTALFRERVKKMRITLLVVDEAHCISQWGHDFRPAYQAIIGIKPLLGGVPTLALTATATAEVRKDIIEALALKEPVVLQRSFARPNLAFRVQRIESKSAALYQTLCSAQGSAIVYAATRRQTRWVGEYLQEKGVSSTFYHAGLSAQERIRRQKAWLQDAVRVMVATNAFGMGINKPDVRLVVHLHFPDTLEAYYQEAGRAGRDGLSAEAVVLYEGEQVNTLSLRVEQAHPAAAVLKATYQSLANYYQIAVGSHADITYPFDLEDFAYTYRMKIGLVYIVLQRLQEAGLIQYNDRLSQPSQVYVTQGAQQLYAFQVRNPLYRPLIRALNHCYGTHVFTDLTRFSLKRIAKYIDTTAKRVDQQLGALHDLGVLTYVPQKKHATITFLTPRYAIDHLPIASQKLLLRKGVMQKKAAAVIHYMTHTKRCRMQLLLEYLGEVSYDRCGRCDLCTAGSATKTTAATDPLCRERIIALLSHSPMSAQKIVHTLAAALPREGVLSALRTMVSNDEVVYDEASNRWRLLD